MWYISNYIFAHIYLDIFNEVKGVGMFLGHLVVSLAIVF